jgi:hypothetical protein
MNDTSNTAAGLDQADQASTPSDEALEAAAGEGGLNPPRYSSVSGAGPAAPDAHLR